jgi:biopolymer transport protein ExbB
MDWTIAISTMLAQEGEPEGTSWLQTVQAGGVTGYIIIGLSIVALALIIIHIVQIRRAALLPPEQLETLDAMLAQGDVSSALQYCLDPQRDSYLTRIMAAGLTRFQKSAFGAFEIKNALEEAGEEQTARLYRSTDGLGVIGAIAPLLGLLGTVLGMVGAFESVSRSSGSNHEQLASNISLALVTTLLGLILAIPCVALFTFFRNRIDSLGSEAAQEIERLTLHLESAGMGGAGPAPAATAARRPAGNVPNAPAGGARPMAPTAARNEGAGP